MSEKPRRTVPYADLQMHYEAGWSYVMPNFDKLNHFVVEWLSDKPPVYPARKIETTNN